MCLSCCCARLLVQRRPCGPLAVPRLQLVELKHRREESRRVYDSKAAARKAVIRAAVEQRKAQAEAAAQAEADQVLLLRLIFSLSLF